MFKFEPKQIPETFGIYKFYDSENNIIYVGKAKNLRKRVSQYFSSSHEDSPKTRFLVSRIAKIDYIITDNEIEALILENNLIKKLQPKYNIDLKDDKTYPYIKITADEFPKLEITRKLKEKGEYFGPFTDSNARNQIYELLIKTFKILTPKTYKNKSNLNYELGLAPAKSQTQINKQEYSQNIELAREFLKGNLEPTLRKLKQEMLNASQNQNYEHALELKNQMIAIQDYEQTQKVEEIKNYNQDIIVSKPLNSNKIKFAILSKIKGTLLDKKTYTIDCEENYFENFLKAYYSKNPVPKEILVNTQFWSSEQEKEILENYFQKLNSTNHKVQIFYPQKGEKKELLELALKNLEIKKNESEILLQIQNIFNLPKLPKIIEFFDMSNLGKNFQVGALTRWENGVRIAKESRKFEIKSFSNKNDDFGAMREVVYRRYLRRRGTGDGRLETTTIQSPIPSPQSPVPDLIIVDGGKGQLSASLDALKVLGLNIPILALAKKEEEIFTNTNHYKLDKNSPAMLFIRKMRDTTHNYVIAYNRKKRSMKLKEDNSE